VNPDINEIDGPEMPASIDIELARSFVAMADAGTLVAAAARVGRTQSALSMQLKRLEGTVGRTLFDRSPQGLRLTAAGDVLLGHATRLLRVHDEALAELSGRGLAGRLRLGCPEDYAVRLLPELLRRFGSRHPRVEFEVTCAPTPRLHERLARHAIDVALVSRPQDADDAAAIRAEPLVWVGRADVDPAALDPLPLALSEPDAFDHQAPLKALRQRGRAWRIAHASAHLLGLLSMARSGLAITVLTGTAVPPDLQVFGPEAGLPPLPAVGIAVACARQAPGALARAFELEARRVLPTL
jgi:DNA-binding transcriptional LysR family regulator